MEIEGGAAPVMLDADSHPNHHLIVHVFDKKTGQGAHRRHGDDEVRVPE
jgi:hypothetical protein